MSLIGVIAAIGLLIVLIYKRVNLIPASLICVLVLVITSRFSFTDLVMNHYVISLSNFIAKYFMVFVTNALFGKVMEETLLVSAFSKMIGKLFGGKNAPYGALLVTALLSYGGISAFVIVFTVYPIFLATFKKADLPRKLIPACIMSASCTFPLSMMPGSAQLNNIIPTQYIGTSPMAAPLVSTIASTVTALALFLYFRRQFALARERGEHFEADGDILMRIAQFEKDPGVRPWTSVLPLVLIILLINVAGMDLSYAVLAGTTLAFALGWKNLPNKLRTLNEGISKVGPAMVITAASVGFGGAVLACPGAQTILKAIAALPFNPTISLSLASSFAGVLTGNGGGGTDVAMNILSAQYLAMGVHPEILHRVVAIATAGFSCLPHNGMLITVS
ncbi:MAG: GntP family permease, partial [Faecousia sp.]